MERMLAFDRPVHVDAAFLAGVTLDQSGRIDDGELVAVLKHLDLGGLMTAPIPLVTPRPM
ncbi:hypothetical protein GGE07_005481 [Sinorhizobium terangae]|nr:hypothetical protein [Sinorhizobium terangae]